MAQGRRKWALGATLGLASLVGLIGTYKLLRDEPVVHDTPQVLTLEEETPRETLILPRTLDATPIEAPEIAPSVDGTKVETSEKVAEGHTFVANVYNFGLDLPDRDNVLLESTTNIASPFTVEPGELKDSHGNSYHRFKFEELDNGLYHLSIQYTDGTPNLEEIVMNGGAISDYVVMYNGDNEEWYSLPALKRVTGKVYDKATNTDVTQGTLKFVSHYDSKIQLVAKVNQAGFKVMVPLVPSLIGTEQEKYTIDGTFSGTDYVAEQWREVLVDGMRLGTRKGETLEVLVLYEETLLPIEHADVYLLDHQGKIVRASHANPATTDDHGVVTFRGVDQKNKGFASRHLDQPFMVFADYPQQNIPREEREKLYQTNLEDLMEVKAPLDPSYGGRVVIFMNKKTYPLEVIVDGLQEGESASVGIIPGFMQEDGSLSQFSNDSPITRSWGVEENFFSLNDKISVDLPKGDYAIHGEVDGLLPEFAWVQLPKNKTAYLSFIGSSGIEGFVYDPNGGVMPDQEVTLMQMVNDTAYMIEDTTDNTGKFTFERLRPKTFNLSAFFGPTNSRASMNVELLDNTTAFANLKFQDMTPVYGAARGHDPAKGDMPLDNLLIEYSMGNPRSGFGTYGQQLFLGANGASNIDLSGNFVFWNNPEVSKWGIRISSPGYEPQVLRNIDELKYILLEKKD